MANRNFSRDYGVVSPVPRPSSTEATAGTALEMKNYYLRTRSEEWELNPINMIHDRYDAASNPVRRAYGTRPTLWGHSCVACFQ